MDAARWGSVAIWATRLASGCLASALAIYVGVLAWQYYSASPGHVRRHHLESAWFWIAAVGILHAGCFARDQVASAEDPLRRRILMFVAIGAVAATLSLYWPALSVGYLSDDFVLLARATSHEWIASRSPEFVRPIPSLAWTLITSALGTGPFWFHALNLTLHATNSVLVFALARRVGLSPCAAISAAAIFLTHPMSVEAVAWASGVQDLLMTAMCLLFVLATLSRLTIPSGSVAIACLLCGLLSKETAIVAPVLALLALVASGRPRNLRDLRTVGVGVALCAAYAVWRFAYFDIPETFVSMPSGYTAKELLSRPFAGLAVPWSARVLEPHPALGAASVSFFSCLLVLFGGTWRDTPPHMRSVLTWAAWVVASVVPVYTYFYISPDLQGSRYVYLGSCGWAIFVVLLIHSFAAGRGQLRSTIGAVLTVAVLVAGCVGIRTALRPWFQAAALRDSVVDAAVRTAFDHSCAMYAFEDLPDSVEGAYVFRNGFPEALQMHTGVTLVAPADRVEPRCRFRWDGRTFVPFGGNGVHPSALTMPGPVRSDVPIAVLAALQRRRR